MTTPARASSGERGPQSLSGLDSGNEYVKDEAAITGTTTQSSNTTLNPSRTTTDADNSLSKPVLGPSHDFRFLPIPKRLRWDPDAPPQFTLLLNGIFGFAATFSVANLYYVQPILIVLSKEFNVDYAQTTNIPTLLQASYAMGLLLICPLGDLVRRRELLLLIVFLACCISLCLAVVKSLQAFEVLSFFLGAMSVTPQILLPLAGDLAPESRRASALSIVLAGLLLGILFARVLAGLIAEKGTVADVYWTSFGLQCGVWAMLWSMVPDYPAKNPHLRYWHILRSMAGYAVTEPVLIQACLIATPSSAIFSCFWTTSTFLLGGVYGYNSLQIGLFALVGVCGVCTAPFTGRLIDRLVPWVGVLIGITMIFLSQVIFTAAAGLSIGAIVVTIYVLDIGLQMQQVSNTTRIFAVNSAARARLSAVYLVAIFIGQLIGTAVGTRIYLSNGYRASGGFCIGLTVWMSIVLVSRGPHCPTKKWVGWEGGWNLRKKKSSPSDDSNDTKDESNMSNRKHTSEGGGVTSNTPKHSDSLSAETTGSFNQDHIELQSSHA